jgi:hypothetical protein
MAPGCYCYTEAEVDTLSTGVLDLQKCEISLAEKSRLVETQLMQFKGPQQGRLWWHEPQIFGLSLFGSFVFGLAAAKMVQK